LAYVEQEPFIFPDSIRNNILFGKIYDPRFYNKVIQASSLDHDLRNFPEGDGTQIGEKGINLSGG
jgi:ATP-binding cassette subfamily C (CFTR/MRP) protein 4